MLWGSNLICRKALGNMKVPAMQCLGNYFGSSHGSIKNGSRKCLKRAAKYPLDWINFMSMSDILLSPQLNRICISHPKWPLTWVLLFWGCTLLYKDRIHLGTANFGRVSLSSNLQDRWCQSMPGTVTPCSPGQTSWRATAQMQGNGSSLQAFPLFTFLGLRRCDNLISFISPFRVYFQFMYYYI